jgi:hypothetical protein
VLIYLRGLGLSNEARGAPLAKPPPLPI